MFFSDRLNKEKMVIDEKDLISVEKCGVCGSSRFTRLERYSSLPAIHLVKCAECGAVTYDRYLSVSKMNEMNENFEYYDDSSDESGCVTFYGYDRFARHLYKLFDRAGGGWKEKDQLNILDFGGGDGSLSLAFAKYALRHRACKQVKILVVDYCEKVRVPDCRAVRLEHMRSLDQLKVKEKFHVVIASADMEHLTDPGKDLKKIFQVMKAGAVAYFRTPYIYPFRSTLRKIGVEYDTLFPGHIWDFGGDKWWRDLAGHIHMDENSISIAASRPSIVEKNFKDHFWIALASYILKAPWYLFHRWPFVGGWETVFKKEHSYN